MAAAIQESFILKVLEHDLNNCTKQRRLGTWTPPASHRTVINNDTLPRPKLMGEFLSRYLKNALRISYSGVSHDSTSRC